MNVHAGLAENEKTDEKKSKKKRPHIHLTDERGKVAHCGVSIGSLVPFREFSNYPCPECIKARMDSK